MTCGIYYYWDNQKDEMAYIGMSKNIQRRHHEHLNQKNTRIPFDKILRNNPEKYSLELMLACTEDELSNQEILAISMYNPKFNFTKGGYHSNNQNEKHGMWRHDISNDTLKEMYLKDYNSAELALLFDCSKRTINRRLLKIFGQEKYDKLKYEKQVKKLRKINRPKIQDADILKYYQQGLNTVEIGEKLSCSDTTVRKRLKRLISNEEYQQYKANNIKERGLRRRKGD